MIIAVDFDGTCVTHEFPRIGNDIGAIPVLKRLIEEGHKLILFTCRGSFYLKDAVDWFEKNKIPLYGINKNPMQHTWSHSPKAFADLYIDDSALGIPLTMEIDLSERPFVNWVEVKIMLITKRIIKGL